MATMKKIEKIGYVSIILTLACGIAAKFFVDGTPINNKLDALEILFFIIASLSCWKYNTRK